MHVAENKKTNTSRGMHNTCEKIKINSAPKSNIIYIINISLSVASTESGAIMQSRAIAF